MPARVEVQSVVPHLPLNEAQRAALAPLARMDVSHAPGPDAPIAVRARILADIAHAFPDARALPGDLFSVARWSMHSHPDALISHWGGLQVGHVVAARYLLDRGLPAYQATPGARQG